MLNNVKFNKPPHPKQQIQTNQKQPDKVSTVNQIPKYRALTFYNCKIRIKPIA